jgi:hypothetical protein
MKVNNNIDYKKPRLYNMIDMNDIVGSKIGYLTVLSYSGFNRDSCGKIRYKYTCKCDCGNIKLMDRYSLINGYAKTCGCKKDFDYLNNLIGKKFSKLTILKWFYVKNVLKVECKCDCGNTTICDFVNIRRNTTKSCGCLKTVKIRASGYCSKYMNNKDNIRLFFNNKCVICGKIGNSKDYKENMSTHHVYKNKYGGCDKSKNYYVTLCNSCHRKSHTQKESKSIEYMKFFENIINDKYKGRCYYTRDEYLILKNLLFIIT